MILRYILTFMYFCTELVMALIEAAYDKDATVREILGSSLFELGRKQPQLVLSSCNNFLMKHSKVESNMILHLSAFVYFRMCFVFLMEASSLAFRPSKLSLQL